MDLKADKSEGKNKNISRFTLLSCFSPLLGALSYP